MPITTLSDLVFHIREISGGNPELLSVHDDGRREGFSTADFLRNIHSLALALDGRGLVASDRVAVVSRNRPECCIVDFACQLLGAVTVPIDPSWSAQQVGFVLRNAACRWVFYDDLDKREQLQDLRSTLTSSPTYAAIDGSAVMADGTSITRLMGEGAARLGDVPIERFRNQVQAEDTSSLLFRLDESGQPVRTELKHRDEIGRMESARRALELSVEDRVVSLLSQARGTQRGLDHLCFAQGATLAHVPSASRLRKVVREERPTVLAAPGAFLDRRHERVLERMRRASFLRRRLFDWGLAVGRRYNAAKRDGFVGPALAVQRRLANKTVYRGLHQRWGGRLKWLITANGEPEPATRQFFSALGIRQISARSLRAGAS